MSITDHKGEITRIIEESFLTDNKFEGVSIQKIKMVVNQKSIIRYLKKWNDIKQHSTHVTSLETFAYTFCSLKSVPKIIQDGGLKVGNVGDAILGSSTKGVHLYRHADVCLIDALNCSGGGKHRAKDAFNHALWTRYRNGRFSKTNHHYGCLIVFKVLLGRSLEVDVKKVSNQCEPSIFHDSHVPLKDNSVGKASWEYVRRQGMVYLYEYDMESLITLPYPSNLYPYAIVYYGRPNPAHPISELTRTLTCVDPEELANPGTTVPSGLPFLAPSQMGARSVKLESMADSDILAYSAYDPRLKINGFYESVSQDGLAGSNNGLAIHSDPDIALDPPNGRGNTIPFRRHETGIIMGNVGRESPRTDTQKGRSLKPISRSRDSRGDLYLHTGGATVRIKEDPSPLRYDRQNSVPVDGKNVMGGRHIKTEPLDGGSVGDGMSDFKSLSENDIKVICNRWISSLNIVGNVDFGQFIFFISLKIMTLFSEKLKNTNSQVHIEQSIISIIEYISTHQSPNIARDNPISSEVDDIVIELVNSITRVIAEPNIRPSEGVVTENAHKVSSNLSKSFDKNEWTANGSRQIGSFDPFVKRHLKELVAQSVVDKSQNEAELGYRKRRKVNKGRDRMCDEVSRTRTNLQNGYPIQVLLRRTLTTKSIKSMNARKKGVPNKSKAKANPKPGKRNIKCHQMLDKSQVTIKDKFCFPPFPKKLKNIREKGTATT